MLRAKLFGVPEVSLDAQSISQALTGRRLALFAYLLNQAQPTSRSVLTDLLWTEVTEERARENLRGLLSQMRRVMGDYLLADRQTVAFNRAAPSWADVEVFGAFWATRPTVVEPPLFTEVLQLYQGELLAGVYIQDAPVFEGWLLAQRQWWHGQAVQGWQQLARHHFTQGDDRAGLIANARLLALEPWHEDAHRRQMLMLARSGQRDAALAHFDRCCAILREEVDAPPDEETIALYEAIKAGAWSPSPPPVIQPVAASRFADDPLADEPAALDAPVVVDWGFTPHEPHFYGRQGELQQLQQWVVSERRRVIALLGVGGQGKTALGVHFVRTLAASTGATAVTPPFEQIIWRSLLTAPPLTAILQDWLQQVSAQQVVTLPHTLEQQFSLLYDYLQQRRFLLVLDNVESILLDDGSGACRPGYEAYEQLWQLFVQRDHQCCLLLTCRERPRVLGSHEEQLGLLRTLLLDGLTPAAGQALLHSQGIRGAEPTVATLVQLYSGNPLALKLVADTIEELFAGNVAAFLQEETPFFDDIGAVLAQQFVRLSPLEVELLTWLALEQEPVTSQTLWENLVVPPNRRDFLTALHTLVRRALVQTQADLFSLQNVILEYTRNRLVNRIGAELTTEWRTGQQADMTTGDHRQPGPPLALAAFNRYALLKVQAKAYIGASQQRLLVKPILDRLYTYWGVQALGRWAQQTIIELQHMYQAYSPLSHGYAAANLLHLLIQSNVDLQGYDFSGLTLRQANLRDVLLRDVNLAGAHLQACTFTDTFLAVTALAFHPGNGLLVTGGFNGTISVWDVSKGALMDTLPTHGQTVFCVAFSHDGATLVTAGIDQRICVWDWATRTLRYTLHEARNFPRAIAFSPHHEWLIVAGGDGMVKFYTVATGQLHHTLPTPSNWLWSVALSADGTQLAAGSVEGPIYHWVLDQQMQPVGPLRTLPGHQAPTGQLLFSHDARYLYSAGNDHLIHIWHLVADNSLDRAAPVTPWRTLRAHSHAVRALALSANGRYLASGSSDRTVRLWQAETGELLDTLVGHEQWVWAVAFQPRPSGEALILASSASDEQVFIWEIGAQASRSRGRLRQSLQGYADSVRTLHFHPDGLTLISGGFDKVVRLWDIQSGRLQQTLQGAQEWLIPVAMTANGQRIAASGYELTIQLWHTAASPTPQTPSLVYHPQPRSIHTGHIAVVLGLAFSPDGKILASSSQDQTIRLWHVQDGDQYGQLLQVLTGHTSLVWSVAFSPNGQWLASSSFDQTIRLWDVSQLSTNPTAPVPLLHTLTSHSSSVWGIAFTPDGEHLVSGSSDHTVRVWHLAEQRSRVLTGHTNRVRAVAVSPQPVAGRLTLASCDDDLCIRMWDVATGETIHQLYGHENFIHSLAYSPDGKRLASAGEQGDIRLWDVQSGVHLRTLRAPRPYTGMNITGVTGITPAQKAALLALGAVEGG